MSVCPDIPKGKLCPECGGKYVCLFWQTHKKIRRASVEEQPKEKK